VAVKLQTQTTYYSITSYFFAQIKEMNITLGQAQIASLQGVVFDWDYPIANATVTVSCKMWGAVLFFLLVSTVDKA
jgi:hypothetical protein